MQEVVVVGFGVQKKINLTGAVSQVKMDDVLGNRPVVNAMAALQGAMPDFKLPPIMMLPDREKAKISISEEQHLSMGAAHWC